MYYSLYEGLSSDYNFIKHDNDDSIYEIEIEAPGYSKESIRIETVGDKLFIKGESKKSKKNFAYQGFRQKKLYHEFSLGKDMKVKDAKLTDGILSIFLEKFVPEEMKPKRIQLM